MHGIGLGEFLTGAVPSLLAFLTGTLLLHSNRESKNPLEWSIIERCLLVIALFCLLGGMVRMIITPIILKYYGILTYVNWSNAGLYFNTDRVLGLLWIFFLFMGWLLRYRSPDNRTFAYIVVQYTAIWAAGMCYVFGLVTHPVAFLGSMAMGTIHFLIFDTALAVSWLITFVFIIVCLVIAIVHEFIVYTPVYLSSPYTDGNINSVHLLAVSVAVLFIFILMLSLLAFIFSRWRDREAKVKEMALLLKKMFGRYLSPEVMNSVIDRPSALELGGERRSVTILMSDLRGFTALSERLEPERVVQMLNAYFEVMVDIVSEYKGTINEIIGDALLVIFGAPQEMPDRARQAVACAIKMQNSMREVNEHNAELGLPTIEMGIGINEAEVIVGNIGSSKRIKYGVVGSGVNMTSRIESYTVGGQILVSESVLKQLGEQCVRIDGSREVMPKGSSILLRVFEVGGIGAPHNLVLDRPDEELLLLARSVPVRCETVAGKDVGGKRIRGRIVRLSKTSCAAEWESPFPTLTDIRMSLLEVGEDLGGRDFYGKVVKSSEGPSLVHQIRFTVIPPEIDAYFRACMLQSERPPD